MGTNQDARPFTDLKKDAKEFREKFDEDINECLNFLDKKLSDLICDPDSLGHSISIKQNTLVEFSKAKYDIFISVKSMINRKEREWLNYISEMKKLFIENVEIFLAGTKLEVKYPTLSEFQPSLGLRKSPGNQKSNSTSAARSIYPILTTLTKNIPVLGSPLRKPEISDAESEMTNDDSPFFFPDKVGRYELAILIPKLSESQIGNYAEFNRRGRLSTSSVKLAEPQRTHIMGNSDSSDSSENETKTGDEAMDVETEFDLNASQPDSRHRSSSNKARNQVEDTLITNDKKSIRGKQKSQKAVAVQSRSTSSDENDLQETKTDSIPLKGRRGKSTAQSKIADSSDSLCINDKKPIRKKDTSQKAVVQSTSTSSDENDAQVAEVDPVPVKGRRGRSTVKNKMIESSVLPPASQITEDLAIANGEESIEVVSNKVRRGRAAASTNAKTVTDHIAVSKVTRRGQRGAKTVIENKKHESGTSSPRKVSFAADASSSDLDIETPIARPTKSTVRRKTLLPNLETLTDADVIPRNAVRSRSKRKTIGGASELETVAPTKRLKIGSIKTASSEEDDDAPNDNLLESDDRYSEWMALKRVDGKVPTRPAVYEVKVSRAKKPAYIGSCDSLRQKLTLYKLKQNSGHKHLDKFIERNYDDIQVRFEIIASLGDAKKEVESRVKSFVTQYKTTPAYN